MATIEVFKEHIVLKPFLWALLVFALCSNPAISSESTQNVMDGVIAVGGDSYKSKMSSKMQTNLNQNMLLPFAGQMCVASCKYDNSCILTAGEFNNQLQQSKYSKMSVDNVSALHLKILEHSLWLAFLHREAKTDSFANNDSIVTFAKKTIQTRVDERLASQNNFKQLYLF